MSYNLSEKYPELEIKSVDGFQGREKEVVIISMVRSNKNQNLGFLTERRRLNVAVTRAKREMILICDSDTVNKDEFLGKFVHHVRERGTVEPAPKLQKIRDKMNIPKKVAPNLAPQQKFTASKSINPKPEDIVALDCEMVGVGKAGKVSVLARISIVDTAGKVLMDSYVASNKPITDYRTKKSGITPDKLVGAQSLKTVMTEAMKILKTKIIVGHGLDHDFETLNFYPPKQMVRDSAVFFKKGKTPSLKNLVSIHLGLKIQNGEHSSVEDARAAMKLYLKFRNQWESNPRNNVMMMTKRSKNNVPTKDLGKSSKIKQQNPKTKYSFEKLQQLPPDHMFTDEIYVPFQGLEGAAKVLEKCRWAEAWMKIRPDKQDFKHCGKSVGLKEVLNHLSHSKMRRWIRQQRWKCSHVDAVRPSDAKKVTTKVGAKSTKFKQMKPSVEIVAQSFSRLTIGNNNNQKKSDPNNNQKKRDEMNNNPKFIKFPDLTSYPADHEFTDEIYAKFDLKKKQQEQIDFAREWLGKRKDKESVAKCSLANLPLKDALNNLSNNELAQWIKRREARKAKKEERKSAQGKTKS